MLTRLGAARSAWNAADIRGEVEQHLARTGIITTVAVRTELAEDLTARALSRCVPLLDRPGVPDHVRALTSAHVLDVEADITGRLAIRGAEPGTDLDPAAVAVVAEAAGQRLDACQAHAVAVLAGGRVLIVVEGAAGAGKTTTLAATRELLTDQGHRLIVVTPTWKAAKAAAAEVGASAGSAAWLVFQHGYRWTDTGTWTRLNIGDPDPVKGRTYRGASVRATLTPGDLLVVDEAGMLDQDTARALLTIADENATRVAFLGDRHQLPAVGRGGVLDLAARWADPHANVMLDVVHRFTRPVQTTPGLSATVPDTDYAQLTLAMRIGQDPERVFEELHRRGQIRLYGSEAERQAAIADTQHTSGNTAVVVLDTVEQVTDLNAAVRDRLVVAGAADDKRAVTTVAGERIGVGDLVATRRNNHALDVANRDTWTVTAAHPDGRLSVMSSTVGERVLPAGYAAAHVELAYATTAYGAQGGTADTAHVVIGEHTGAAAAYVGMTRGRQNNTAHLIATDIDDAREQWVATFGRDRADAGVDHARTAAERAAAQYAAPHTVEDLIGVLHREWDNEAQDSEWLAWAGPRRDALRQIAPLQQYQAEEIAPLEAAYRLAGQARTLAEARAEHSDTIIMAEVEQHREALLTAWKTQRPEAQANARTVLDGPGRLRLRVPVVNRASAGLARWAIEWQPIIPDMPTEHSAIAHFANRADNTPGIHAALEDRARQRAAVRHPEHELHVADAAAAYHDVLDALAELLAARDRHQGELSYYGRLGHTEDPHQQLAQIEQRIATTEQRLAETCAQITGLEHRLMVAAAGGGRTGQVQVDAPRHSQPTDPVTAVRGHWLAERDAEQHAAQLKEAHRAAIADTARQQQRHETWRRHEHGLNSPTPDHGIER